MGDNLSKNALKVYLVLSKNFECFIHMSEIHTCMWTWLTDRAEGGALIGCIIHPCTRHTG